MTIVVAEIGVNWEGDFELVKEMMEKSKSVGCDAVKFQAFNKETIGNHPLSVRLLKSSISFKYGLSIYDKESIWS